MRLTAAFLGVLAGAFVLAFVVHRAGGVEAGTAVRMDVAELARHADLIVEANILSARSFETDEGRIETEFILAVERTLAGADQPLRAVRMPGGILPDGRGMMLAGMPHMAPGERTLLFLAAPSTTGVRMPVGLAQGKFQVAETPLGEKVLLRDHCGLSLIQPGSGKVADADGWSVLPYAEVMAQIEAARATTTGAEGQGR